MRAGQECGDDEMGLTIRVITDRITCTLSLREIFTRTIQLCTSFARVEAVMTNGVDCSSAVPSKFRSKSESDTSMP